MENNKPKYDVVIFDLDGTLMNTSPGIFSTANWTMKQLGLEIETDIKQLSKFIGPPLKDCFRVTYNLKEELIDKACEVYRAGYNEHGKHLATVFDGMEEVLEELNEKGVICCVGTMKHEKIAKEMIIEQNLDKYFKLVYGSDIEGKRTKTTVVQKIVEELGVSKDRVVLVGDTEHDKLGAKQAGIPFIGVSYGFGYHKNSEVKDNIIAMATSPKDVLSYLYCK